MSKIAKFLLLVPVCGAVDAGVARGAAADALPGKDAVLVGGDFEVEAIRDLPYVDGPEADSAKHKLDLFVPKGKTGFPVVFFIHGGAWRTGDRKLYGGFGYLFAKNGVGAVVISYRLSPRVRHPAHIEDVASAFAWTHRNIGKYGGRADRIFVTGQSAGGHLAALLATDERYLKAHHLDAKAIRGVMPISGVYVIAPGRFERVFGSDPEIAGDASPVRHVTGNEPPFQILYADKDFPGCDRMSAELHRRLLAKNRPSEMVEIADRNHISIMLLAMSGVSDPVPQRLLRFIAAHSELKLAPRGGETGPGEKDRAP